MMTRTFRFRWTLLKATIILAMSITAPTATAQLSRARNAARRSASPPPAPVDAKPAPEPQKEATKPAPVVASPQPKTPPPAATGPAAPAAAPAPKAKRIVTRPQPPATKRSSAIKPAKPEDNARPAGTLSRARQKVRQPKPAPTVPPMQPPTPPRDKPVHHRPRSPKHHHHKNFCAPAPLFVPTWSSQTVIVDNAVPIAPTVPAWGQSTVAPPAVVVEQSPMTTVPVPVESVPVVESPAIPEPVISQPPFVCSSCVHPWRFADYPYAHGFPGLMARGPHKEWSGSVLFEYGSSFDGLDRRGFAGLVEHSSRWGLDFKWDSYVEDLGDGWTDELHFTDVNVLFRVAQSEHYVVRAGLGMNILGDAYATDGGFNFTAKADVFPVRPLVLSGELDLGTIGDAETFHVLGKVGLIFDRFEIFGGYDYRTIGSVPLEGAMLGMQIWF